MKTKPLFFSNSPSVPLFLQVEASECGLACLAMIAKYHGHDVDLNGLRQIFPISNSGVTLKTLIEIADQLSLSARALRLELDDVKRLKLPAILHWNHNHFVVLKSINSSYATIHDPAEGELKVSLAEFSLKFTGITLELLPSNKFEPIEAKSPVRLTMLWGRLSGFTRAALQILVTSLLLQITAFAMPFFMQLVVDKAVENFDVNLLLILSIGFLLILLIQTVTELLRDWLLQLFGQQFIYQVIGNLVHHLLTLPANFFETRHVGDILSRMQSTKIIQDTITRGVISALLDGAMATIAAVILISYSPKLAVIVFFSVLVLAAINLAAFPLLKSKTDEQLNAGSREQTYLMETIRAAVTIKILGKEAERESAWRNLFVKQLNGTIYIGRLQLSLTFARNLVLGIQYILIVYLGAEMIIEAKTFTLGMLIAFLSFRQTFSERAANLVSQIAQFKMVRVHLDRLGDIVSQESETKLLQVETEVNKGKIELVNISFKYGISDKLVLDGLNLTVAPGEFIAIKGPSGGGKSTLLKLLLGIYEPTSGQIKLDESSATNVKWRNWRRDCGVVLQDDRLLSGTIAENIAFFDSDINMKKVIECAKTALIHDEIIQKPMQYQTYIGDMGAALSGGQKQRILLARALYRDPKILFLDEGTANLDEKNENDIAAMIRNLPITRVIIAHRPTLINFADKTYELIDGRLIEQVRASV